MQVSVRTYDWDIISTNAELGAASLLVEGEALPFTAWYPLDKGLGQYARLLVGGRKRSSAFHCLVPSRHGPGA
ncbi:unnamed protein product, partial [Closterium sp. NIES-54]